MTPFGDANRGRGRDEHHLSPGGRRVVVRNSPDSLDALLLVHGALVARLGPPDPDAPARHDGRVEWQLRLDEAKVAIGVLGWPSAVPLDGALAEIDYALSDGTV